MDDKNFLVEVRRACPLCDGQCPYFEIEKWKYSYILSEHKQYCKNERLCAYVYGKAMEKTKEEE